ncbi:MULTISPECIES: GntR family transcriptional regulator [unclassified Nocardioides]|uniref:GntR family transcriptional regulator n=1 Tax=unclassified Nocardioides TaxID=2615069 RepID=UPI00360CC84A
MTAAGEDGSRLSAGNLPRVGQGSLTERTTQALLEAILERRFPSDRLPNEPDLADQMGVSRTTIRAALQSLDRLGVISRAPGRGTQLRPHIGRESMLLHRVIGLKAMLENQYGSVDVDQTFTVTEELSPLAADALGLGHDTQVLLNDKTYSVQGEKVVRFLQEVPLVHVVPADAEALVAGRVEAPPSIFEWSRSWPGREIDHSVVELVPLVASGDDIAAGMIAVGAPHLEMRETHYSDRNEPIAYGREVVNDEFVRMRLVRTR